MALANNGMTLPGSEQNRARISSITEKSLLTWLLRDKSSDIAILCN